MSAHLFADVVAHGSDAAREEECFHSSASRATFTSWTNCCVSVTPSEGAAQLARRHVYDLVPTSSSRSTCNSLPLMTATCSDFRSGSTATNVLPSGAFGIQKPSRTASKRLCTFAFHDRGRQPDPFSAEVVEFVVAPVVAAIALMSNRRRGRVRPSVPCS